MAFASHVLILSTIASHAIMETHVTLACQMSQALLMEDAPSASMAGPKKVDQKSASALMMGQFRSLLTSKIT